MGHEVAHLKCGLPHLIENKNNSVKSKRNIDEHVDALGSIIEEQAKNTTKLLRVSNTKMHTLVSQVEKNNLF